jgi:hypothetical protein
MVQRDGFDDRIGQAPEAKQIGTDLGVSRSEFFLFEEPDRLAGLGRFFEDASVLLGQTGGHDQFTDIVQQAGEEILVFDPVVAIFEFGDASGAQAGGAAMLGEVVDGEMRDGLLVKL